MDIDQLARAMKDLEYRVKLLEKAQPQPMTNAKLGTRCPRLGGWCYGCGGVCRFEARELGLQFCECGKDKLLCRAPECPSHKPDPMGR